jgi:hypothetical protein
MVAHEAPGSGVRRWAEVLSRWLQPLEASSDLDRSTLALGMAARTNDVDHRLVRRALAIVLERIQPVATRSAVEYRVVGTAAAMLRGVPLPVGDLDILLKERRGVDLFAQVLSDFPCITPPTYLADARQYFANYDVDGVTAELSTVEWASDSDAVECIGSGPWDHFSLVGIDSFAAPVVALELRIVSELVRGRTEQFSVIAAYLRRNGCDIELMRRGMCVGGVPEQRQSEVLAILGWED